MSKKPKQDQTIVRQCRNCRWWLWMDRKGEDRRIQGGECVLTGESFSEYDTCREFDPILEQAD